MLFLVGLLLLILLVLLMLLLSDAVISGLAVDAIVKVRVMKLPLLAVSAVQDTATCIRVADAAGHYVDVGVADAVDACLIVFIKMLLL